MGHDEVIVGTEDGMRGVLRFRASGSRALPEDLRGVVQRLPLVGLPISSTRDSIGIPSNSMEVLVRFFQVFPWLS